MKKRIFAALMALCLMAGTSAFAQERKMMPKERPTAEQMAQHKADRMKAKLNLNDAQTKQIYEMSLAQFKEIQAQHEKMKTDRSGEAAKMKSILTPEQYKQWEEMQAQMKMHGRRDGMKGKADCQAGKACCKAGQDGKACCKENKADCKDGKACCKEGKADCKNAKACCKDGRHGKKCDKPAPEK